jgi:hypothetical protein
MAVERKISSFEAPIGVRYRFHMMPGRTLARAVALTQRDVTASSHSVPASQRTTSRGLLSAPRSR